MSKITERIFKGKEHCITSAYGPRKPIETKYGKTSPFHYGTDYGTNAKKIEQYAVENGVVLNTGYTASAGNYMWIKYPRLNVKMCHYHLDSIKVVKGQTVDNNTVVAITGTTGYSTGIHLHLGVWDLNKDWYVDPEIYAKTYVAPTENEAKEDNTPKFSFNVGNKVILNANSTYYQHAGKGVKIPTSVKNKEYTIKQIDLDNECILLTEINSWVLASECRIKDEYTTYTVVKGDTLWALAQRYNTSVAELVKLNNIANANLIRIGQVLKMPR